jgi:hypothetical protein
MSGCIVKACLEDRRSSWSELMSNWVLGMLHPVYSITDRAMSLSCLFRTLIIRAADKFGDGQEYAQGKKRWHNQPEMRRENHRLYSITGLL